MLFEYIVSFLLLHAIDYGYLVLNKTKISKYITAIQLEPIQFKYKYLFISYILISYALHLFVMPIFNGTGIKEFKYYADKFKYLWFILWACIATVSVWREFKTAGYPFNQLWMWTGASFSFIIFAWWQGLFKIL